MNFSLEQFIDEHYIGSEKEGVWNLLKKYGLSEVLNKVVVFYKKNYYMTNQLTLKQFNPLLLLLPQLLSLRLTRKWVSSLIPLKN